MGHSPQSQWRVAVLMLAVLLAASLPAGAEYTKLYRIYNHHTDPPRTMQGIDVVNNSLEVVTRQFSAPSNWKPATVSNIVYYGTYCTRLVFEGGGIVLPGNPAKVGWSTSDNNCRLRRMKWIDEGGVMRALYDPEQLQGVAGGGEVRYDPETGEYVWLLINDTEEPIDLSNVSLQVLEVAPATIDELAQMVWPEEALLPQAALMRSMTAVGDLPHPDIVHSRVQAVIDDHIQPLMDDIEAARDAGYISDDDRWNLVEDKLRPEVWASLTKGDEVYPGESTQGITYQDYWDMAVDFTEEFKGLVGALEANQPILFRPSSWPYWGGVYGKVNDGGVVTGYCKPTGSTHYAFLWDSRLGDDGFVDLHAAAEMIAMDFDMPPSYLTTARDINSEGYVVGAVFESYSGRCIGVLWWPDGNGGYTVVGVPPPRGYSEFELYGINDSGQIVAWARDIDDYLRTLVYEIRDGGVYPVQPDPIPDRNYAATAINNVGQIGGMYSTGSGYRPFRWDPPSVTGGEARLVLPRGSYSGHVRVQDISDDGYMVGDDSGSAWAWLNDDDATPIPLGSSKALGVNSLGDAVGYYGSQGVTWDLYAPGYPRRSLHASAWGGQSQAVDVNDAGGVAGWCQLPRLLPEGLADAWRDAADALIAAIQELPGPPEQSGEELPPPAVQPPPPPPPGDEPGQEYVYESWDDIQEDPEPQLPADSYTAFVVPDDNNVQDESLLLTTAVGGTFECVELYTPPTGGVEAGDTTPPTIEQASIWPETLWRADGAMVEMTLDVQVSDSNDEGEPQPADWFVGEVTSDQPEGGLEPDWVLDEQAPHSLLLRAERDDDDPDGRTYTVTVKAIDPTGNVSEQLLTVHVPAATTVAADLSRSWYRFSVPVQPDEPSPADVLAGLGQARRHWLLFDVIGWRHHLYPNRRVRDFTLGRGYWLKAKREGTVEVTGQPADPGEPFDIELPRGWSIIGCPFNEAVGWDDDHVMVTRNDETLPLTDAVRRRWLWPTIYGWHNAASATMPAGIDTACFGFHRLNVPVNPWWAPGEIEPWQGYLISARRACTLSITGGVSTESAEDTVAESRTPSADDWRIRLVAEVEGFGDICTAVGVGGDAPVLSEPHPPLGPGVDLFVESAGELPEGSPGHALDLRGAPIESAAWDLVVATAAAETPVRISWPDLSELPNDLVAYFVDPASGKRVYMRTQSAYEFVSGGEGAQRQFRVEVRRRDAGAMVSSMSALPGDRAVEVVFTLSCDAQVQAEVLNIAGRPVRTLVADRDCESGVNSLAWNCCSDRGLAVPNGTYLIRLTARTDDGRQASGLCTVKLQR